MLAYLPLIFLASFVALFGISWIVVGVDPDNAPIYIFGLFSFLLFICVWGFLGLLLYFLRTRIHRRYSHKWYFQTSFKMAFFVALFVAISAILAILQLVTTLNLALALIALVLIAVWSYLGKKDK